MVITICFQSNPTNAKTAVKYLRMRNFINKIIRRPIVYVAQWLISVSFIFIVGTDVEEYPMFLYKY